MLYEQKKPLEESFIKNKIYEKPHLALIEEENIIKKSKETLDKYKKKQNNKQIEEEKNNQINEKQNIKRSTKKDDPTDKLLNISYINEIFKKNNPKFLENFEFLESIKAGSAGAVLKAKLKKMKDKNVACKILPNNKEEKNINKKHREVLIHKSLHYKNIPELYGFYPVGENYSCMVMEHNIYGDIDNFKKKIIKRSYLSESLINYFSGNIIDALSYLSRKKIIHMDIKQQNIIIDDFLNLKLTDYSVSLHYNDEEQYIQLPMVGTSYYMSPEVLEKRRILVSEASKIDIYSLGVLLYFLAFNDYPYNLDNVNHHNYKGIYNNIKENELKFPKDTGHSDMFKNFLKNCLEKDIKKRYNIYQAMNDPWMKGYKIICNEKESLYNASKFMIELLVDNIKKFNDYIKNNKSQEDF